jgi:hypothetical protein
MDATFFEEKFRYPKKVAQARVALALLAVPNRAAYYQALWAFALSDVA